MRKSDLNGESEVAQLVHRLRVVLAVQLLLEGVSGGGDSHVTAATCGQSSEGYSDSDSGQSRDSDSDLTAQTWTMSHCRNGGRSSRG